MSAVENTKEDPAEPDSKCPICLQPYEDMVILNNCFHAFCRFCIFQWAEYEPARRHGPNKCPLCRTQFQALYHNYCADSQSYDVTHMEKDVNPIHWSQYHAEEDSNRLQTSDSKNEAVVRHRRLLVYARSLLPIIDFKMPKMDQSSPSYASLLRKLSSQFQSKAPQFIARELPILLLHSTMRPGSSSYATQQSEVSLLTDLIMALLPDAIPSLLSFALLRSQSPINQSDSSLLTAFRKQDNSLDPLYEAIFQFLPSAAPTFLRELALFVVSPYSVSSFELNVHYVDPTDEGAEQDGSKQ